MGGPVAMTLCGTSLAFFHSVSQVRGQSCIVVSVGSRLFGIGWSGLFTVVVEMITFVVGCGEVVVTCSRRHDDGGTRRYMMAVWAC